VGPWLASREERAAQIGWVEKPALRRWNRARYLIIQAQHDGRFPEPLLRVRTMMEHAARLR
jgi:hypothetical protein